MISIRILPALVLFACIDIHPSAPYCEDEPMPDPPAAVPTFHDDIRPIMREACARCHATDGIAGFSIDTYQEVIVAADAIRREVETNQMPPWKPVDCCQEYARDGGLDPIDKVALLHWLDSGMPLGEEREPPEVEVRGISRVDLEISMPDSYIPNPPQGTLDDTRCFILDWPLETETNVTGLEIAPGNPNVVHHALVLTADPDQAEKLEELDADDPGPGWSCPGGIVANFSGYLGGWGPGFDSADFPEDLGQPVEPGSKLILTMHYSLHSLGGPDQSTIRLKLDDGPVRRRKALAVFDPTWLVGGMPIAKNDTDAVHSYVYEPTLFNGGNSYDLFAVNLHMHERGSRGQVSILRANGDTECLVQIDDWDYDRGNEYEFKTPVKLNKGDRLFVECRWNNTAGNQIIVNGVPEEPRDLNWAEDEEMCIAFITAGL